MDITVSVMMRDDASSADATKESLALAALENRLLARSPTVPVLARYVLLDRIGSGGLSVVFRAYDPDLDRRVALKLMRLRPGVGDPESSLLLREARVIARLCHPNVVTVHDVGTYSEYDLGSIADRNELGIPPRGVFLVMELLDEGSLRDVLRQSPSPRRVLSMVLAAGRGIAAAHAEGIVHRDFKPANVLVGADGGVRVADFGLAGEVLHPDVDPESGTPAYMAPEQLEGQAADALSDQYAFALTAWVALFGDHPFAATQGRNDGESLVAPRRPGVSRRVSKVLQRALSVEPGRRYPDLPAMLRALEATRVDRRRRIAAVGAAVIAVGFGAATIRASPEDPCASAGSTIDAVWSDAERQRLHAAFLGTHQSFAERTSASVLRILDEYAERWRRASRATCEDTHVHHVQSEVLLDRRTDCLERHRRELAAAVGLLGQADAAMLANAVQLVHGLGWIGACDDLDAVASQWWLPQEPARREAVQQTLARLGEARLLELSGRYIDAKARAEQVLEEAEQLDDAPLQAAALFRVGSVAASRGQYRKSRRLLLRSIQIAQGARQDALAADGWIRLLWVAGVELDDTEQSEMWVGFAQAALRRLHDDPLREAQLVHNLGGLYYRRGQWDAAFDHYQRALVAQRTLLGDDTPDVARTLNHIANVLLMSAQPQRSLEFSNRSLEIRRELLGPQHPLVAASFNNIAAAHLALEQLDRAERAIEQALSITVGTGLPEEVVARRLAGTLDQRRDARL